MSKRAVIAGYARTAFQPAGKGAFARTRPDALMAAALRAVVERSGVDPERIEDAAVGCAFPEGEQGLNVARLACALAGLPDAIGAVTINRFCGSSMQAAHHAAGAIALSAGEAFLAGGVESMTRVPIPGFNPAPHPELARERPAAYMSMGETAEIVAARWKIDRSRQEEFALHSHRKAAAAQAAGRFADEIVEVDGVNEDGCVRPDASLEAMAGLAPAFSASGAVTAATSSPLTDGASALLVASEDFARRAGLEPLAAIRSIAVAGCDPEVMGIGPVAASRKALERAGLEIDAIDAIELNEAFAAQALACIDELGIDPERVNLDGGAIALGHPLGATGARILGKAASLLKRENHELALVTQCIGGGQGIATILEAI